MCGDLPVADQACQAIHAAHLAGRAFKYDEEPHLVFLKARDEADLLRAADRLDRRGIEYIIWSEPDLDNRPTALATEPMPGNERWFPRGFEMWEV